jgi:hypothetical protein
MLEGRRRGRGRRGREEGEEEGRGRRGREEGEEEGRRSYFLTHSMRLALEQIKSNHIRKECQNGFMPSMGVWFKH